ncbi:UNVERIFIED_CONTAM: hypothetical protein Slati_1695700 [Sesamum latifolium]|uniref:Uncharacterized protein n=1 Tax=Sesamum latifolium TaxID=2727402 RepID=A0AAW2WVZ2_9LAMI
MGIESPVETCIRSRIHWMSAVFHRRQTWDVYAILMGWLTRYQADWTDSRGSSYGSLGGLVGMTRVPGSNSTGVVLGLEESWQSRTHDDCILGLCER